MNPMLKKTTYFLMLVLISNVALGQKKPDKGEMIPLKPENWEFKPQAVAFEEYKSVPAMKISASNDPVVLKNMDFTNGTIEYDMEPLDPRFTSFYFHRASAEENECFYFRTARAGDKTAVDAIQYAPHVLGVNL